MVSIHIMIYLTVLGYVISHTIRINIVGIPTFIAVKESHYHSLIFAIGGDSIFFPFVVPIHGLHRLPTECLADAAIAPPVITAWIVAFSNLVGSTLA
jgi:hypothetical protein